MKTIEAPLTLENMSNSYGLGYSFLKKYEFNGKGYENFKNGIQVPLDSVFRKYTFGLGFNIYKQTSLFPLNAN